MAVDFSSVINLPAGTKINRFISKEKIYARADLSYKTRQLFVEQIEKITWLNKISPETINTEAGVYQEIQVFLLNLKTTTCDRAILTAIDTHMPYLILFILVYGEKVTVAMSYKRPIQNNSQMRVEEYFIQRWQNQPALKIAGLSIDDIYRNLLEQLEPDLNIRSDISLELIINNYQTRQNIKRQIESLLKKQAKEPSVAKKQQLARQIYELKCQL